MQSKVVNESTRGIYVCYRDDLNHLPYLTLCIKESMRMHAPVPTIGREVQDELVVDGVTIPAGTNIQMSLNGMHHNEDVWGDDHEVC